MYVFSSPTLKDEEYQCNFQPVPHCECLFVELTKIVCVVLKSPQL